MFALHLTRIPGSLSRRLHLSQKNDLSLESHWGLLGRLSFHDVGLQSALRSVPVSLFKRVKSVQFILGEESNKEVFATLASIRTFLRALQERAGLTALEYFGVENQFDLRFRYGSDPWVAEAASWFDGKIPLLAHTRRISLDCDLCQYGFLSFCERLRYRNTKWFAGEPPEFGTLRILLKDFLRASPYLRTQFGHLRRLDITSYNTILPADLEVISAFTRAYQRSLRTVRLRALGEGWETSLASAIVSCGLIEGTAAARQKQCLPVDAQAVCQQVFGLPAKSVFLGNCPFALGIVKGGWLVRWEDIPSELWAPRCSLTLSSSSSVVRLAVVKLCCKCTDSAVRVQFCGGLLASFEPGHPFTSVHLFPDIAAVLGTLSDEKEVRRDVFLGFLAEFKTRYSQLRFTEYCRDVWADIIQGDGIHLVPWLIDDFTWMSREIKTLMRARGPDQITLLEQLFRTKALPAFISATKALSWTPVDKGKAGKFILNGILDKLATRARKGVAPALLKQQLEAVANWILAHAATVGPNDEAMKEFLGREKTNNALLTTAELFAAISFCPIKPAILLSLPVLKASLSNPLIGIRNFLKLFVINSSRCGPKKHQQQTEQIWIYLVSNPTAKVPGDLLEMFQMALEELGSDIPDGLSGWLDGGRPFIGKAKIHPVFVQIRQPLLELWCAAKQQRSDDQPEGKTVASEANSPQLHQ